MSLEVVSLLYFLYVLNQYIDFVFWGNECEQQHELKKLWSLYDFFFRSHLMYFFMLCVRAVCVTKRLGFDLGELLSSVQRQAGIAVNYSAWVKDSFKQRLFAFLFSFPVCVPVGVQKTQPKPLCSASEPSSIRPFSLGAVPAIAELSCCLGAEMVQGPQRAASRWGSFAWKLLQL